MSTDLSICCMTPKCQGIRRGRGVCTNCYARLLRLVQMGETTWQELEASGRCQPAKRSGWNRFNVNRVKKG